MPYKLIAVFSLFLLCDSHTMRPYRTVLSDLLDNFARLLHLFKWHCFVVCLTDDMLNRCSIELKLINVFAVFVYICWRRTNRMAWEHTFGFGRNTMRSLQFLINLSMGIESNPNMYLIASILFYRSFLFKSKRNISKQNYCYIVLVVCFASPCFLESWYWKSLFLQNWRTLQAKVTKHD